MWRDEANKVLESLKRDYARLQNKFDSLAEIGIYKSKEFDAICYEMCAVEQRIAGLVEAVRLHENQLELKKEMNTTVKMFDKLLQVIRKVGA